MPELADAPASRRYQLGALWASIMFCYLYCDYFELYTSGKLESMLQGRMGPLGAVSEGVLLATSLMMAVPSVMVAFSVIAPARPSRVVNLVVGVAYTALLALIAATAGWWFYRFFATLEALLTAGVVWLAWHWPRAGASEP